MTEPNLRWAEYIRSADEKPAFHLSGRVLSPHRTDLTVIEIGKGLLGGKTGLILLDLLVSLNTELNDLEGDIAEGNKNRNDRQEF